MRTTVEIVRALGSSTSDVLLAPTRDPSSGYHLERAVDHLASTVSRLGVSRTDVVASLVNNGPEAVTVFLASAAAGIAAPLNPAFKAAELSFYLEDLRPRLMIVPEDAPEHLVEASRDAGVPILRIGPGLKAGSVAIIDTPPTTVGASQSPAPDDVALILHTSGTTSRPKMVPLTHANLTASAAHVTTTLQLTPDDRVLNVMPLFHIHGLVAALLAPLYSGGSIVATPGYIATQFFDWMTATSPTWYTAVPTIHQSIVERVRSAPEMELPTLRFIRSSSASLPPAVMKGLESAFGAPVIEAYGMTEAAHQMSCNPLPPARRKSGSVGIAAGPEVSILTAGEVHQRRHEIGEVVVRGPNVTAGYLTPAEDAFIDGWFRTGDLGRFDEDGYLILTGRSKEMINRAGETIAPREIDEVLLEHELVRQALAFGVPDHRLGEQPAAAVVLEAGAAIDELSLRKWVEARLSSAKVPRRIIFMDSLPLGPTGKLQRIGMAERLELSDLDDVAGAGAEWVAPRTRTEEVVAEIWSEVLDRDSIGVEDRFLDLGGDSMLAIRLLTRVRERLQIDPSIVAFFDRPTVAAQAELIDELLISDV
ncbi:MAG: non-ribosomal peptide synthetase [Acidimicrobiia bacterium]|nr:non-ribosomal peptide synthetase [Acidimicrobiia bacterium]